MTLIEYNQVFLRVLNKFKKLYILKKSAFLLILCIVFSFVRVSLFQNFNIKDFVSLATIIKVLIMISI